MGAVSLEIVGVIEDVRLLGLDSEPKPEIFAAYPLEEAMSGTVPHRLTLALRADGDPARLAPMLRKVIHELEPALAVEVTTLESSLSKSVAQPRFYALLLGSFALMALVLASTGVYGLLAESVARQTRAIGVRRALGARSQDILSLVFRKGLLLTASGLGLGFALAFGSARLLSHLLFGITTRDPISYLLAGLTLATVAMLACYLPARRASGSPPWKCSATNDAAAEKSHCRNRATRLGAGQSAKSLKRRHRPSETQPRLHSARPAGIASKSLGRGGEVIMFARSRDGRNLSWPETTLLFSWPFLQSTLPAVPPVYRGGLAPPGRGSLRQASRR